MSRGVFAGLSLAFCIAVAGCTGGNGGPTSAAKYKIAVIPKGMSHEFWQSIHRGAEQAAKDLSAKGTTVEIVWDGPREESEALEQIKIINQKKTMGVHGIVLAPQHSKQMVPPVEQAVAKGIPVVIIDSNLDKDTLDKNPDLIVKYVATNNKNGGRLAAKALVDALQMKGIGEPKLVLFRYAPGSESTEQREEGFLEYIGAQQKAGIKIDLISQDKYAGATVDSAQREALPLLTNLRDKGIDGIFAVNESAAQGMLNALKTKNMNKEVKVVGFDSSEPLLQAVRDGDVDTLIVQDPYRMGYVGVWTLVHHLEGYDVREGTHEYSTGEYPLNKGNIDSPEMVERYNKDAQVRRQVVVPEYKKK
jgi:ribose transport system substrate-binding protein